MVHQAGKKVFFHTDGNVMDIYEDLIEVGVDAINSQLFCMDIEEIARRFKGRVTFWGEIDRQQVLAFGTVDDVYRAVARVRRALDDGRGGVIAQCQWGIRNPPENIVAVYEAWQMPLDELLARTARPAPPTPSGAHAFAPAKVSAPFVEGDFQRFAGSGSAAITGTAVLKTPDGEVRAGGGDVVSLIPSTAYTRERFQLIAEYPRTLPEPPDPRLAAYVRTTPGGARGEFEFRNIPPGEYILACTMRWQYFGRMGQTTGIGQAVAYATVAADEVKEVELSG
jgi:hypothetical protein